MSDKRAIIQTMKDGAGIVYHLPPRKKRIYDHNLNMRLIVAGTIPSLKNTKIASISRKRIAAIARSYTGKIMTPQLVNEMIEQINNVKPFVRNSKRYMKWHDKWAPDLALQAARWKIAYEARGLIFPLKRAQVTLYHYWRDDIARDNTSTADSVHDCLVHAGILVDDRRQCLYKTGSDSDLYKESVKKHLTVIHITAHEW